MNAPLRKVEFQHGLNAPREEFVINIKANMARGLDSLQIGRALLVAGGPSAADHIEDIRQHHKDGWKLFAVNGAHDWLIKHGILPDAAVAMDATPIVNTFIQNLNPSCTYYLASQCHPSLIDRLLTCRRDVVLWHAMLDEQANDMIAAADPKATILAPANTVSQHAAAILYTLGYRKVRAYGLDSSHRPGKDHAYNNSQQKKVEELEFVFDGKRYLSTATWAAQAQAFVRAWTQYFRLGLRIEVIGDGLLPDMVAKARAQLMTELAAC